MKFKDVALVGMILLSLSRVAWAQEISSNDAGKQLAQSLAKLVGEEFVCKCNIESNFSPANGTKIFEGELEVAGQADGAIAAASGPTIPRVMLYLSGEEKLFNVLHDGISIETDVLSEMLSRTLNFGALIKKLELSQVSGREIEGGHKFRVELTGMHFGLGDAKQIEDVVILANVNANGDLAGLAFRFTAPTGAEKSGNDTAESMTVMFVFDDGTTGKMAKAFAGQAKRILKSKK